MGAFPNRMQHDFCSLERQEKQRLWPGFPKEGNNKKKKLFCSTSLWSSNTRKNYRQVRKFLVDFEDGHIYTLRFIFDLSYIYIIKKYNSSKRIIKKLLPGWRVYGVPIWPPPSDFLSIKRTEKNDRKPRKTQEPKKSNLKKTTK